MFLQLFMVYGDNRAEYLKLELLHKIQAIDDVFGSNRPWKGEPDGYQDKLGGEAAHDCTLTSKPDSPWLTHSEVHVISKEILLKGQNANCSRTLEKHQSSNIQQTCHQIISVCSVTSDSL